MIHYGAIYNFSNLLTSLFLGPLTQLTTFVVWSDVLVSDIISLCLWVCMCVCVLNHCTVLSTKLHVVFVRNRWMYPSSANSRPVSYTFSVRCWIYSADGNNEQTAFSSVFLLQHSLFLFPFSSDGHFCLHKIVATRQISWAQNIPQVLLCPRLSQDPDARA